MAKLFLSYAREDAAIAGRLARALERGGDHDVWWDRDIHGGASFGSEIEQQLCDCDVVIVLWSGASVNSPWVRDEATIGRDAQKLIPIAIDAAEPPIGFRQFHTIPIGTHGRPSRSAIRKLEQAIDLATAGSRPVSGAVVAQPKRRRLYPALAGAIVLLITAAAGIYWWHTKASRAVTIAIVPAAGQPPIAAEYANAIATDMAAFLSAHGELASVLDPSDPGVRSATYRYSVGYSGQGSKVDMTISLTGGGEEGILWSRSWRADDPAAVDLKKQMSFGAARALLCALEASRDPTPLGSSLLRLYIVACSGLYGDEAPATQLASEFAQIAALRPRFAPAWQNLAIARSIIFVEDAQNNGVQSAALRDATLAAIGGARKLTPNSGRLLLAQANLANLDWRRELPLLDRAIALEPNEAIFYTIRSTALQEVGRMEDAVADAEKGVELDPLSPIAAASRINALMYAGQLTNAKDEIASAYKIWPNDPDLKAADFGFSMRYGDPRHGEQLVTKVLTNQSDQDMLPVRKVLIARENPTQANIEEALSAWRAAMESFPPAANHYLLALGTFGRMEEALRLAANSKLRPFLETQIFFRPEFEKMRHDPRFMAVAAQYGLVRYWKSSGNWPDFCSDVGLPYQCKTEAAKYS